MKRSRLSDSQVMIAVFVCRLALLLLAAGNVGAASSGNVNGLAALVDELAALPYAKAHCDGDKGQWQGLTVNRGRVIAATVIDEIGGFAREAGTNGGLGGQLLIVTDPRDYDPQERSATIRGTLRSMVEQATAAKMPAWIVFDSALESSIVALKAPLRLPDNITLDGSCANITIVSRQDVGQLYIFDHRNVIVYRLAFRMEAGFSLKEGQTCIRLNGAFDGIAILHNEIDSCGDGAIDITVSPNRPVPEMARVTIAYNRIRWHDEVMLFGTFNCVGGADRCTSEDTAINRRSRPSLYLTLDGNYFVRTGQRHPRVYGRVMAHVVNNVVAFEPVRQRDGRYGSAYGVFVSNGARALVERNVFIPLAPDARPARVIWTTSTKGADMMPDDSEGFIRADKNLASGPAVIGENEPGLILDPGYQVPLRRLNVPKMGIVGTLGCVSTRAGRSGTSAWRTDKCEMEK